MPNKKQWIYSPVKPKKPQVPAAEKEQITEQCQQFIDSEFKPRYIIPNPEKNQRIITDIYGKWYRSYYYFCCTYRFNTSSLSDEDEDIEDKFTRLEYIGEDKFNLAYMRHTGQWWEVNKGLRLKRSLEEIKRNEIFHP